MVTNTSEEHRNKMVEEDFKIETQNFLVPFFYKQGRISEEDYKKWLLDETGKFRPKVKM